MLDSGYKVEKYSLIDLSSGSPLVEVHTDDTVLIFYVFGSSPFNQSEFYHYI